MNVFDFLGVIITSLWSIMNIPIQLSDKVTITFAGVFFYPGVAALTWFVYTWGRGGKDA